MRKPPPLVLVIAECAEIDREANLALLLEEHGAGRCRWALWTVMDAYMKDLPADMALAVLDVGLISPLHMDLVEKIVELEMKPLVVHATENRPDVIAFLEGKKRLLRLKKPASIREVAEAVEDLLEGTRS